MQKGQVHDLFGDEQSVTGTQNRYSQKTEKGPHPGAVAGGSTNPGGWMLRCGGVCGCVQVRARASGPSSATGRPSVAFIFLPASPFTPGSADPAGFPATGGQAARTTVWERPPRIHQVSRAAAPPGGRLRNDLRKNGIILY